MATEDQDAPRLDALLRYLRPPDKRARQRALMHQAAIVAGELKIILERLEELLDEDPST